MNQTIFEPKQFPFRQLCLAFCLFLLRGVIFGQTAQPYDILINEFMAAPSVGKNLPNSEFIELYNRDGVKTFNLKGYKFYNGSVNHTIDSNFYLKPKQYVIVYKKKTGIDFSRFGPNIPMAGFISLSNPGDTF